MHRHTPRGGAPRLGRALSVPVLVALALSSGAGLGLPTASAATPATVSVENGRTPQTRPFPDDAFTVADSAQRTGRRVALPTSGCEASGACADLAVVNTLDGFDIRPRVRIPFTGPVDLLSITPSTVRIEGPGGFTTGLTQLVEDPSTGDVTGHPVDYLAQGTTYTLVITNGVRATDGTPVSVGTTSVRRSTFTTMTTTNVLDRAVAALDDGSAYAAAGISDSARGLAFDTADNGTRSVFPGTIATRVDKVDQVRTGAAATSTAVTTNVPNTAKTFAYYGFASLNSPQYLDDKVTIPQVPTTQAPAVLGAAKLGVAMVSPAPSGTCIRPVIFGHGFTGNKFNLFLAADTLGTSNLAVFSTDVVGHGFGPQSSYRVTAPDGTVTTGRAYGRGRDQDGNGTIDSTEGVQAAGAIGSSQALIQTVVDNMALARALQRGVDVDGNGTVDTCTGPGAVAYYGQSFGGIYGTMLLGTDPSITTGVPNVAGGPVPEIVRLGGFRPLLPGTLGPLRNGGPGLNGFTESQPLRRDPRVAAPLQGALAIQESIARTSWVDRPGDPTAYAFRLGKGGLFASKHVIFQIAYGDGTVPNPTAGELLRAGDLYDRAWIYRNDRTANAANNPHSFLLIPTLPSHFEGQEQIRRFIATDGVDERDPDTPEKPNWEPAVAKAGSTPTTDYRLQLDCLHYPDPQTGLQQVRTSPAQECTDLSGTVAAAPAVQGSSFVGLPTSRRVLDTRTGTAPSRTSGLLTVDLRSVVPDAAAGSAVLTITVTGATRRGHVVAFPSGAPVPPTSNVNVEPAVPGRNAGTQANEAVVKLSQDRKVDLFVATTAHVVVDVVGYFTTTPTPGAGLVQPVTPTRVLDSRRTSTPRRTGQVVVDLAPALASAATVATSPSASGTVGTAASATATAVVLNVTAVSPSARGFVVAWPTGTARPSTSNVNVEAGQTQSNEVVVPLGAGGQVSLDVVGTTAGVVVDLVGVVRAVPATTPVASPAGYVALPAPLRAADSRKGLGLHAGRVRGAVSLVLPAAVPANASGVFLNVTATGSTGAGFVTVYPAGSARPRTSNVNFPVGLTQANEAFTGIGTGRAVTLVVDGARTAAAYLVVDVVGYTLPSA